MKRNKVFSGVPYSTVITPEDTAHHEAGHVAMAIELRIPIDWAGIERTATTCGCTVPCGETMPLFAGLLFTIAGPAASHIYNGKKGLPIPVSVSDGEVIERYMRADQFEVFILHMLRFLSSAPGVWCGIEALAIAMLKKQRLTGAECIAIYRNALDQHRDEINNYEIDPNDLYKQFYELVRAAR